MGQIAYTPTMETGGGTDRTARNQVHSSHRKEHILSCKVPTPQKARNAHSATTATTPLQNGPKASRPPVASIADNPNPSRNDFKIKRLRSGIIGDARSPIIAHHILRGMRKNCKNPHLLQPGSPCQFKREVRGSNAKPFERKIMGCVASEGYWVARAPRPQPEAPRLWHRGIRPLTLKWVLPPARLPATHAH